MPYINASTITYSHPSLPHPCRYIAAQGPLPRTAADFWSMVLELQVPVVLMLTNCREAGMVKCSQYFPDQLHAVSRAGSFEVQVRGGLRKAWGKCCRASERWNRRAWRGRHQVGRRHAERVLKGGLQPGTKQQWLNGTCGCCLLWCCDQYGQAWQFLL